MLLIENMDLCLQLAEYIEFLEVFLLRDNGVIPLCNLLQLLTSGRLKSVGFCFCKVSSVQLWGRITDSLSTKSHQYQADKEEDNLATSSPRTNFKALREKSIFFVEDTCNQLNCEQEKTASKGTSGAQTDLILDDYSNINEATCDPLQETDNVDIYAFNEWNDAPKTGESALTMFSSTCKSITSDISGNVLQSVNLYDEVFGHNKSGQPSEVPTELSPQNENWVDKSSELCRFSPGTSKLESPLSSLPNLSSSLVHFELVAFWPHPDLFAFFVQTLKAWLALETIILEDNGLGLASTPGQEFVDTLAFLCTKGKLQSLQITNNAVNDEFAKLLFERLLVALCRKCNKSCDSLKSLTKLKFSSHQVSPMTSVYLGKAITDVCTCKLNNHSMVKMLESVFSTSDSATDIRDSAHACYSKQKSSYVSDCMISESSKSSWKTNYSTVEYDNTQKLHLGCKINAEQTSHFHNADLHVHAKEPVNSSENFSQGKKPLLSFDGISNMFVGIQVLQMSCMVGNTGASSIAEGLRRNSTLRCLSLAGCDINTDGLAQIFQALSGEKC